MTYDGGRLVCFMCGERPAEEFEPSLVLPSLLDPSLPRYVLVRHRNCRAREGWTGYLPEAEATALRQRLDKGASTQ